MASSDQIKHTDLAEDGVTKPLINDFDLLTIAVQKADAAVIDIAKHLKKDLGSIVSPKSIKDVNTLTDGIAKQEVVTKTYTKTLKALTVEEQKQKVIIAEKNKQTREQAKDQLGLISVYQKASKELNELRNSYKELSLAGRENGVVGRGLLQSITEQDKKLKSLDSTVGQHQRNVGNYTKSVIILQKGLGGLTGLVATLGRTFGFNTEYLEGFHNVSKTLIKVSKEMSHASHLEHLAHKENTGAILEEEAADKASSAAKNISLGVIGLVGLAVAGLAAGIWYLVNAEEESTKQLAEETKKLNENEEAIRKNKIARAGLKAEIQNTKNETAVLMGTMSDPEQKRKARGMEQQIKEAELLSEKLTAIANEEAYYKTQIDEHGNAKSKNAKRYHEEALANIEINWHSKRKIAQEKYVADIDKINVEALLKNGEEVDKNFDAIEKKTEEFVDKEKELLGQISDAQRKVAEETQKNADKLQKEKEEEDRKRNERIREDYIEEMKMASEMRKNLRTEAENERKANEEARKAKIDAEYQTAKELNDIISKMLDERIRYQQETLTHQLSQIDNAINIQQQRFNQGLSNTLAFEQREKAKALEKQAALDKKAHKQKQAEQLAEVFMEFAKVYAKDGPAGLAKAIASTFGVKAFELALAGNFAEGVENFQGKGTGTSDSNIIGFSNGESVLTAKGTAETSGLASAINEFGRNGAIDWALNELQLPKEIQGGDMSLMRLVSEMKEVKKAIEDKPVFNWEVNKYDELVQRKLEKGNVEVKTFKRWGGTA